MGAPNKENGCPVKKPLPSPAQAAAEGPGRISHKITGRRWSDVALHVSRAARNQTGGDKRTASEGPSEPGTRAIMPPFSLLELFRARLHWALGEALRGPLPSKRRRSIAEYDETYQEEKLLGYHALGLSVPEIQAIFSFLSSAYCTVVVG